MGTLQVHPSRHDMTGRTDPPDTHGHAGTSGWTHTVTRERPKPEFQIGFPILHTSPRYFLGPGLRGDTQFGILVYAGTAQTGIPNWASHPTHFPALHFGTRSTRRHPIWNPGLRGNGPNRNSKSGFPSCIVCPCICVTAFVSASASVLCPCLFRPLTLSAG